MKLFIANDFFGYLDGTTPKPPNKIVDDNGTIVDNTTSLNWILIDQNNSALYSTISSSLQHMY